MQCTCGIYPTQAGRMQANAARCRPTQQVGRHPRRLFVLGRVVVVEKQPSWVLCIGRHGGAVQIIRPGRQQASKLTPLLNQLLLALLTWMPS